MSWDKLSADFLTSLALRGLALATLKNAGQEVRRWMQFCRAQGLEPGQVQECDLEGYRQALLWGQRQSLALPTQTCACQWTRQLLRWAFQQGFLLADPGQSWKLPKVPERALAIPSVGQILTVLAALPTDRTGLRDRAVMETLYGTGLRVRECQNLDLWDLKLPERQLHVRSGKGGRSRIAVVGEQLEQVLVEYLERSRPGYRPGPRQSALFLGRGGCRLPLESYRALVRRAGARVGLEERLTPHLLRHAFASHLLEGGAPVEAVSALLGHRALRSTQRYTHVSPQALHQEHQRTHPRSRTQKESM